MQQILHSLLQGSPQNILISQKLQYHAPTSGQKVFALQKYSTLFCEMELQYHSKYSKYFLGHKHFPNLTIIYSILQQNVSQYFTVEINTQNTV